MALQPDLNTTFPTELRAMPWPNAWNAHNGDPADEVTLAKSFNVAFQRTDVLKAFVVDVEKRLMTRFFSPISSTSGYAAAELARIAQEAAALPNLIAATKDAAEQARDIMQAQQGTLIYYQGQNEDGSERLYALAMDQFRDSYVDLVVSGKPTRIPVIGVIFDGR